jgi:hypothetical protein
MRLARFRRSRLLAGVLLLASPGGVGGVLPVLHPCPVDAPWLATHAAHGASHQHHAASAGQPAQDSHGEQQSCHCIGACCAAALLVPPAPQLVSRFAALPLAAERPRPDAALWLAPVASLLPPSTAPPIG